MENWRYITVEEIRLYEEIAKRYGIKGYTPQMSMVKQTDRQGNQGVKPGMKVKAGS